MTNRPSLSLLQASLAAAVLWLSTAAAQADYIKLSPELTIHYETAGQGDRTIVFIPGWMMSTDVFEHQLAHFESSTDFTALAYDPRGQGRSSKTIEGHSYQQHGRDLAALLEALELDHVILAGWSYGVTEQLAYLDQFGDQKIAAMVMIDSGPDVAGASYDEWVWYLNDDSNGYARWFTEGIIEDRQNVITEFGKWMLEDPNEESMDFVADVANQTPSSVAALLNATGFYLDYSEDLAALEGKMPLLYVVREEWQPQASAWIAENTPSARAEYLGKHMMFWERPQEFNAILDSFLNSLN